MLIVIKYLVFYFTKQEGEVVHYHTFTLFKTVTCHKRSMYWVNSLFFYIISSLIISVVKFRQLKKTSIAMKIIFLVY